VQLRLLFCFVKRLPVSIVAREEKKIERIAVHDSNRNLNRAGYLDVGLETPFAEGGDRPSRLQIFHQV
jgi:hypothetical protein